MMNENPTDWQRKSLELKTEMIHRMTHDSLTGLPNRDLLSDRLQVALAHAHRNKERLAVMILDVDNFRRVIHRFGHTAGDDLLRSISLRLQKRLRQVDTIARPGGDEFIMVLTGLLRRDNAAMLARTFLDSFREPYAVRDDAYPVTISIGISIFPEHGEDGEELLKNADIALYQAKEGGRNTFRFYRDSI